MKEGVDIPIEVTLKDYFRVAITVMNPVLKLREREIEVLSIIMLLKFMNQDNISNGEAFLGTEVRKKIMEVVSMTEASFNNHLSGLRKKGVLTPEGDIPKVLEVIFPTRKGKTFRFNIKLL